MILTPIDDLMTFYDNIYQIIGFERVMAFFIALVLFIVFITEFWKYIKYRSLSDVLELSGAGFLVSLLFGLTGNMLLAALAGLLGLMLIGVYEVRESPIWVRMMGAFTISYFWFFLMTTLGYIFNDERFTGLGYNLLLWVMLAAAFAFFGRKFIIVTRFISPQMVYLVIYLIVLLIINGMNLDWGLSYIAIFSANIGIYLISGYLLEFLFGIKPLNNERVERLISEVQGKIDTPIRKVGIVKAPILNAFAYGPWFDQRIAYITEDIDKFTDEEILGITAHELAHLKKKHTLWLLGITAVEFIIKAIFKVPATYWDFVLGKNSPQWTLFNVWIFNLILFSILLTIVKALEGQADRVAGEAGYGLALAESLYRLEGFYYGIAGEIGLNAQLLSGKKRLPHEEKRFMGAQAANLFHNLAPSRVSCLFNLIASHPLTSVRIALQLDRSLSPVKVGMISWLLLLPVARKKILKRLQKNTEAFAAILSEKYQKDYGTINDYLEESFELEWAKHYRNHFVLAKPWLLDDKYYFGEIIDIKTTSDITSPIVFVMRSPDGQLIDIPDGRYKLIIADLDEKYVSKKGDILILKKVIITDGKFKFFVFENNQGKELKRKSIGIPYFVFKNKKFVLLHKEGAIHPYEFQGLDIKETYQKSVFTFSDADGKSIEYFGKDLILVYPPFIHVFQKRNLGLERPLFNRLKTLGEPFIIYDKEDIDIGRPGIVIDLKEPENIVIKSGRDFIEDISQRKIDAIFFYYPFILISIKKEVGWTSRFLMRIFDRDIQSTNVIS